MLWDEEKQSFVHELGEKVLFSSGKDQPWEYTHTGTVIGIWMPRIDDCEVIHYLIAFDVSEPMLKPFPFAISDPPFGGKREEEYVWNYADYIGKMGDWVPRSAVKFLDREDNPKRFLSSRQEAA